jgi:hypothetical protein
MNRSNTFLVAAFMSANMFLPSMAQAIDIIRLDQMTNQNRQDSAVAQFEIMCLGALSSNAI